MTAWPAVTIRSYNEITMKKNSVRAAVIALLAVVLWGQPASAQLSQSKSLDSFVSYMQSHHRAPFDRDNAFIPPDEARNFLNKPELKLQLVAGTNVKINQDRNPWPKAEVGPRSSRPTGATMSS